MVDWLLNENLLTSFVVKFTKYWNLRRLKFSSQRFHKVKFFTIKFIKEKKTKVGISTSVCIKNFV